MVAVHTDYLSRQIFQATACKPIGRLECCTLFLRYPWYAGAICRERANVSANAGGKAGLWPSRSGQGGRGYLSSLDDLENVKQVFPGCWVPARERR